MLFTLSFRSNGANEWLLRQAERDGAMLTAEAADSAPRFDLLGPLCAWRQRTAIALQPGQQSAVLAVLLLHANRPLSRQQLIRDLWGDDSPAYAVNLLQKHISGLRRLLEPERLPRANSRILSWTSAGYLFKLPAESLDISVFETWLDAARTARSIGDLTAAADALRAALQLWRGPLCDGLPGPLLESERGRLAERRIAAIEDRVDVDLLLGGHHDLIADLQQLVTEHPDRERVRGQLMLALYRSGRQSEALAAFRSTRQYLQDELGVEPGHELQELHQRILSADITLTLPQHASALPEPRPSSGAAGPVQLPHDMADFTGREVEFGKLDAMLAASARNDSVMIAAIAGAPGVGKTTLAVQWAHRVMHEFPDGQLYVNLRGFDPTGTAMSPPEAIRAFLDALAIPRERLPVSLDAQAALYRTSIAGSRMLIVLDNAADANQVRPLLPGSRGCAVIVTSRNQLTGLVAHDGAQALTVDLLTDAESRQFLRSRLGADRVNREPESVAHIVDLCARLPLALSVVAARAAVASPRLPLSALAAELREAHAGLDMFESDDDVTNVRAVFSWSYRQLPEPAQHMFRLVGWHPGPDISVAAAASLIGATDGQGRRILRQLAGAHLVEESSPGRFVFHDLLRAYAGEQTRSIDAEPDRMAATRRALDHYLHSASAAAEMLDPHPPDDVSRPLVGSDVTITHFRDVDHALQWCSTEHGTLLAMLRHAMVHRFDEHLWRLSVALVPYFDFHGHWRDFVTTQRWAVEAAGRLGDTLALAVTHRLMGVAHGRIGAWSEGQQQLQLALSRYEELDNGVGQAHAHRNLASICDMRGDYREGLEHSAKALLLFTEADDLLGEGKALNAVGWFRALLGDAESGRASCEQAFALQQAVGDRSGEAETSDSLGFIYRSIGDNTRSVTAYRHAFDLYSSFGDSFNQATCLSHLGNTYHGMSEFGLAAETWTQAAAIFDELDPAEARSIRLKLSGLSASAQGSLTAQRVVESSS